MRTVISWRQIKLSWHKPQVDCIHIFRTNAELTMLSARSCGEDIIVVRPQPMDHTGSSSVDEREFTLKNEGANDKIVVRMHVVATARAMKNFFATRTKIRRIARPLPGRESRTDVAAAPVLPPEHEFL